MRQSVRQKAVLIGSTALVAVLLALWWLQASSGPPAADPFEMGNRCAWYDPDELSMQWTYYLATDDGALVYVGFAGRLRDPAGEPFAGINLVVLEENREVINLWQRYSPEELVLRDTDLDVNLGANAIGKQRVDGRNRYTCHLELDDGGRSIVLDAAVDQTVDTCRAGGFTLLSWEEQGHHNEYEIPCPRGRLSGSLTVDGERRALRGDGYLESIRWLRSPVVRPVNWYWGYAHADPFTVLFFKPGDYPHARTLLTISRGRECEAVVLDGDLRVSPPTPESGVFSLRYEDQQIELLLDVDTRARKARAFPIYIAPYDLDLRFERAHHRASGTMVFEIGRWDSF